MVAVPSPPPLAALRRAAKRAQWAVRAAFVLAVAMPVAVWLHPALIVVAVVPYTLLGTHAWVLTPATWLIGVPATLVPCALLGWGLAGLGPLLRGWRDGRPMVGQAGAPVARLGSALIATGLYEPLGRALLMLALTVGLPAGERAVSLAISDKAVLLVALGATLAALGAVLREAARAVAENEEFV